MLALAVVCALAFVCLAGLRRLQDGASGDTPQTSGLRFVRALPLGPRELLVVVEWRGELLLLGVTAGGITVLDRGQSEDFGVLGAPNRPDPVITPAELTRALLFKVFARRPRGNPS